MSIVRDRRALLAAAPLLVLLAILIVSGGWPELRNKVAFSADGVVAFTPAEVRHVRIRAGAQTLAFDRHRHGWTLAGRNDPVSAEIAAHLETAIRLLHVSAPAREISSDELTLASFSAFGLDTPAAVVVLESASGDATIVNIGTLNPASTAHYVRLSGRPTVYLVPRHVGQEWLVTFDMARRLRGTDGPVASSRGNDLLLPVSMTQVWAVEIVFAGRLTRFERDPAGNWFRHVGQHSHTAGTISHIADPEQARIIDAAFGAFDTANVERYNGVAGPADLARFGLDRPMLITLWYSRDSSMPLARLEFGAVAGGFDRYARLAATGQVVTVAEFEITRLTEMLRAVGAGS